jgi:hypothetical protein
MIIKCPHCDTTMEAPDDGWLYAIRHQELFGAKQHSLEALTRKSKSVKELDQ